MTDPLTPDEWRQLDGRIVLHGYDAAMEWARTLLAERELEKYGRNLQEVYEQERKEGKR